MTTLKDLRDYVKAINNVLCKNTKNEFIVT